MASDTLEIKQLLELCRSGRIYSVEQWIAEGRPIQVAAGTQRRRTQGNSPLVLAIETRQYDLAHLLLCNGYQVSADQEEPVETALSGRYWDMVDLLLEWGADPSRVDADVVLDTYRQDMFDRFWEAGNDFTRDDYLAHYLASTTSNRPLYGWVRRHRDEPRLQRALAMALVQATWDAREKAVSLLRWAGADPHVKVPLLKWRDPETPDEEEDLYSAVEVAVGHGDGHLLRAMPPDPDRDDLDELWADVRDPATFDCLMAIRPPSDWSETILCNVCSIIQPLFRERAEPSRQCLQRIALRGGRLTAIDSSKLAYLRLGIVRMTHEDARRWTLWWLSDRRRCAPEIYADLVRTPKMRAILKAFDPQGRRRVD